MKTLILLVLSGLSLEASASAQDVVCSFGDLKIEISQGWSRAEGGWSNLSISSGQGEKRQIETGLAKDGNVLAFFDGGKLHVVRMNGKDSSLNVGLNSRAVPGTCCEPGFSSGERVCFDYPM